MKQEAKHLCWYCNEESGIGHFCEHCSKLQPAPDQKDYFTFMGFKRKMQLDPKQLEEAFYSLSRKFHPDFYQNSSAKEKTLSLERTAVLNNAFQVLKDPIQRVEYLLDLECPIPAKERAKTPPALLQEIFEIQEVLESYRQAKATKEEIEKVSQEVLEKIRLREKLLEDAGKEWDRLVVKDAKLKQAQKLRSILDELTYLKTLLQSIRTGGAIIH